MTTPPKDRNRIYDASTWPAASASAILVSCAIRGACLQEYGIAAVTGAARGSFCDGRYNVLVGGRKIAGTAQRRVERRGGGALLAQATLLVAPDLELITRVVSAFYAVGGGGNALPSVASITSLQQHVSGSGPLFVSQCAEVLVRAVDEALVAGSSE